MFGGGALPGVVGVLVHLFTLAAGLVAVLLLALVLVLLVRFLWFGTRAAQLYLARNGESPRFTWPPAPLRTEVKPESADPAPPRKPKSPPAP
jgi:hypothetical protein